jgi:hypothetical protein
VNYEALNQYVLIAIGLFAVLLYIGMIWVGFAEFVAAKLRNGQKKKRSRFRGTTRQLRNAKRSN